MKGLTLSTREQSRIQVLNKMIGKEVPVADAAGLMGVSERHAWRLLAAYREEGAAAIAHGNRGRRPSTATAAEVQERVLALAQGRYAGFNHSHLTEMLAGREGIHLSRSTVRRVLLAGGVRSPRRRRARRRYLRRARYPQEGMLLQIDGSRHDWLEGRGPRLTLIGAVDDATGMVPFALFREQEDAQGYMLMLKEVIERCGVPLALYSDRHSIFQRSPLETESRDEQLRGRREPTQFARALAELGIELILAHTPQAKGRVERAWDTFQDRLVSEMRLAGTATIEEANRMLWDFLPRYDQQFGVAPAQQASAYRQLPPDVSLEAVLCFKYLRTVAHDNTIRLQRRSATTAPRWPQGQLRPGPRGSPGTAGRQHRGRPPGQNRGHEAGPRRTGRAQGPQRSASQRPTPSRLAPPLGRHRTRRTDGCSPPSGEDPGSYPHQANTHPSLEESATDIIIEQQP